MRRISGAVQTVIVCPRMLFATERRTVKMEAMSPPVKMVSD